MNSEKFQRLCPRALLTEREAVEIYLCRKKSSSGHKVSTNALANKYNVSPKAIRDIWNRRTWAPETRHLWTDGERPMIREKKSKTSFSPAERPADNFQPQTGNASTHFRFGARSSTLQPLPCTHHDRNDGQAPFSPCDVCINNWKHHPSAPESLLQLPDINIPWRAALEPAHSGSEWFRDAPTMPHPLSATDSHEAAFPAAARDDPFHSDWPHW
jgi:hypothetical protein